MAHPINSIVLSIAPALKDVVWTLLQALAEAIGQTRGNPRPGRGAWIEEGTELCGWVAEV